MPLVEAAASAGHKNAMEGNGWFAMAPMQVPARVSLRLPNSLRSINGFPRQGCGAAVRRDPPRLRRFGSRLEFLSERLRGANSGEEFPDPAFEIGCCRGEALGQGENVPHHGETVVRRVLHSLHVLGGALGI